MQILDANALKKSQEFSYKAATFALHSKMFEDKVFFEGFNKNLMLFNFKAASKNEKFAFDMKKKVWYNTVTNRVVTLGGKSELSDGSNVATAEYDATREDQKWELVSCEDAQDAATIKKEDADAKEELEGEEVDDGSKKKEENDEEDKKNETPE